MSKDWKNMSIEELEKKIATTQISIEWGEAHLELCGGSASHEPPFWLVDQTEREAKELEEVIQTYARRIGSP